MGATLEDSDIAQEIRDCKQCPLHSEVLAPVRGEGPKEAKLVIVGRNPGRNEDRWTRPFVGRAGEKLTKWIELAGFKRPNVGILNMVKCFTPGNRCPSKDEISSCQNHLKNELQFFDQIKILVLLGTEVVENLMVFEEKVKITQITGNIYNNGRCHIFTMYHPSYVLRNPGEEKRFFRYLAPKMKSLASQLSII